MKQRDDFAAYVYEGQQFLRSRARPFVKDRRRMVRTTITLAGLLFLGSFFLGDNGFLTLLSMRHTLEDRKLEVAGLQADIQDLESRRRWILEDPDAAESILRRQHGYTDPNAIIYDFE